MRVGVTLPQFRDEAEPALATARAAEEAGLDGVFVFDHLWSIGRPGSPALAAFPLLAALGVETRSVSVGTLVARVGLVPDAVLVNAFATAARIVGRDRLVAGVGTGDRLSVEENEAYGVPFGSVGERRRAVAATAAELRDRRIVTWVGGGAAETNRIAGETGAALNLWQADPAAVAAAAGEGVEVTWGGRLEGPDHLRALRDAGASWAVASFSPSIAEVAAMAAAVR